MGGVNARRTWRQFHTPNTLTTEETLCRQIVIPLDDAVIASIGGALEELTRPENWEEVGTMTPQESAELMTGILYRYFHSECGTGDEEIPTPYWDDQTKADDEMSAIEQIWYGNWIEGEFVESVGTFLIAGFVAYAATPAAAIFFLTLAPRFRLAWRTGSLGGIIRVIIDGADYGTVDTYSATPGIIEKDFITDPDIEEHEVIQVLEGD